MNKQVQIFTLFLLLNTEHCLQGQVVQARKTPEFVIAPAVATKKMSLNTLKEHVGKKTKQAFEGTISIGKNLGQAQCELARLQQALVETGSCSFSCLKEHMCASAAYNRVLGTIQQKVSLLQQKFSSIIEKLIDNQAPFKKASKKNLESSFAVLTTVHQQLSTCSATFQRINNDFKKVGKKPPMAGTASVQAATKELQAQAAILEQAFTSINTDQCLKNA